MLKVKPFLFILFLTVFVALFTTACSDTGSSSSGGIYDNSTTNPGGGGTENPGGGDTENPGGGEEDKPGVTAIDLAGDPFTLLGVYDVTLYGIDEEPVTSPVSKSELRVGLNLSTAAGGMAAPEVIMYLDFEGKKITFDKYIINLADLANYDNDLNKFIAATFSNLGAELIENSKYGLYFTLDPNKNPNYSPVIDNLIIKNGQYLKLKLDKAKDLEVDSGLGLEGETPTDPEEPENPEEPVVVPVDSVTIKGQPATVVHGGASFKLTAEVLPNDATNKIVTWSSSHPDYIAVDTQGKVTIKGYTEETITIIATSTADKTKTDSWKFNIEKATVTAISVNPNPLVLALRNDGSTITGTLTTSITPLIAAEYTAVSYKSNDTDIVTVDDKGVVTAVKDGTTTITVTVGSITETVDVTVEAAPITTVPVTSIEVTSVSKVYKKGSDIQVSFKLLPANTTDKSVNYSTPSGISGTVTAVDGIGTITLAGVQTSETLTITTLLNHTAAYELQVVDEILGDISFENENLTKEQDTIFTNNIVNKSSIENSIASWTYSSDDANIASVDPVTGQVTAKKNGVTMIRVTAQPKYDAEPLQAEFKIDVLGHIDYTDETSLQGTYDIVFFGTNSNGSGLTAAVLRTNCDIYKNLWNVNSCPSQGTFNGNYEIPNNDFAGRAIIKVSNGALKVHTKVAMLFTNMGSMAADAAKNDRYQYTVYEDASLNTWLDTNHIGHMPGRNLSATTNPENPKYYFEQDKKSYTGYTNLDIVLFSHFEGKSTPLGKVNPDTRLILRKISSQVITMDPNSLTEEPFNKINLSLGNVDFTAPME
ncbi:MAG: Ig-like domain-containing protein [Mucispirillum sp.]|nr:Ig-like domain-containing protein [Mucispirillum sp.]